MWATNVNRTVLTDIMCGAAPNISLYQIERAAQSKVAPNRDEVVILWHKKPNIVKDQPNIIITPDGMKRDVLAWLFTYFPQYRPITSITRVIEVSESDLLFEEVEKFRDDPFSEVLIDLIIAEARGNYLRLDRPIGKALVPYLATVSFCMAKSFKRSLCAKTQEFIFKRWLHTRMLIEQDLPFELYGELKNIWQLVLSLSVETTNVKSSLKTPYDLLTACTHMREGKELPLDLWEQLVEKKIDFYSPQERANLPREDRLKTITALLRSKEFNDIKNSHAKAFIAGYLVNSIASGTLGHLDLFFEIFKNIQNAHLWYALCSGLSRKPQTTKDMGALERRLFKELHVTWQVTDPPSADLSIDEFDIVCTEQNSNVDITSLFEGIIIVELWPGISTYVKLKQAKDSEQRELFEDIIKIKKSEINSIKKQVDGISRHLNEVIRSQESVEKNTYPPKGTHGSKNYYRKGKSRKP